MLPYWLLFSVFAAGSLQYRRSAAPGRETATLLMAAAIFAALMIGLRYEVGGDWQTYLAIFDDMQFRPFGSVLALSDPGYAALNWAVKQAGIGIWAVNLVCAAIFMWGLTRFARRQANPWLAIAIAVPYLIIVVAMGYTRQAVAIGIILAGITRLEREQSMVRFGLYVLVAATFHKSAIIVLPLVAFAMTRNKMVMLGIAVVMAAMLYYLFVATAIDRLIENYVIENMIRRALPSGSR